MLNKIDDNSKIGKILPLVAIGLTILFIVLKIVGVVHWSLIWVLCPLWLYVLFVIVVIVVLLILNKGKNKSGDKPTNIKLDIQKDMDTTVEENNVEENNEVSSDEKVSEEKEVQ